VITGERDSLRYVVQRQAKDKVSSPNLPEVLPSPEVHGHTAPALSWLQKLVHRDGLLVYIDTVVRPIDLAEQATVAAVVDGGIVTTYANDVCGWARTVRVREDRGASSRHLVDDESHIVQG